MKPASGPQIELGYDDGILDLLEEREALSRRMRLDQKRFDAIKETLAASLGEATYARMANWELYWSETLVPTYTVPEKIVRRLWVKRIRYAPPRRPKLRLVKSKARGR